jgi:hypothetical protein
VATATPFHAGADTAAIRLVVDHQPGLQLVGQPAPTGELGASVEVELAVDGSVTERRSVPMADGRAVGMLDLAVEPGTREVEVRILEGGADPTVLYAATAEFDKGSRLVIDVVDEPPPPGAREGREVFDDSSRGGCGICHSTTPGDDGVGPSLAGVGTRAADTVAGLDAEAYLRQSILEPDAHVVEGYPAGQMLPFYDDRLSADDLDALVVYLLGLTGDTTGEDG